MTEKVVDYIRTILADPAQRSRLLARLEKEGYRAADLLEENEENQ